MKKKPHFFTVIKRYYFLYLSFGADGSGHGRIVLSGNTNKLCLPEQESVLRDRKKAYLLEMQKQTEVDIQEQGCGRKGL